MTALSRSAWPLGVAAAAFAVAVGLPAGDPDTWWHLASGRWMVEHRELLRVDVFSSTVTGEPYALGEWLGEILLYLSYAAGSWLGVAILRAACVALAAFALARSALRTAPSSVAIPLVALALVLSKPIWTDRPQLFTVAFVPLVLELLLAARAGSRGALVATVPLLFIWSDLHAGYALGLALLWLFALEALIERRRAGAFLTAALVGTAAVALDPGALPLLRVAGHIGGVTRAVVEESPVDVLTPFGALLALFVAATFLSFLRTGASLLAALILVPLLWLALTAQRYIPYFGFAAVPFLGEAIARDMPAVAQMWRWTRTHTWKWTRRGVRTGARPDEVEGSRVSYEAAASHADAVGRRGRDPRPEATSSGLAPGPSWSHWPPRDERLASGIAIALWIAAIASIATAAPAPDLHAYPVGAASALRSSHGVLLNEYDWGGWLIWNVPERPVFVDGRLFPFAAAGVLADQRAAVVVLPGWHAIVQRWNVAQALLRPDRALAQALRDEGWTVVEQDAGYVLLERPK